MRSTCPPHRPSQPCWSFRQYFGVKIMYRCQHTPYFFGFLFYSFWILSFYYSLPFLLSFSISSYSPLLISSYSSRLGTILRLLFLLLLYFKLFVDLQTCILMIYHMYSIVHISVILKGFSKGPKACLSSYSSLLYYVLPLLIHLFLYLNCLLYYRHAY